MSRENFGMCHYYFEMSHLIPNLKCHIERVSFMYLREGRLVVSKEVLVNSLIFDSILKPKK
jgi:hypothetical protein